MFLHYVSQNTLDRFAIDNVRLIEIPLYHLRSGSEVVLKVVVLKVLEWSSSDDISSAHVTRVWLNGHHVVWIKSVCIQLSPVICPSCSYL